MKPILTIQNENGATKVFQGFKLWSILAVILIGTYSFGANNPKYDPLATAKEFCSPLE